MNYQQAIAHVMNGLCRVTRPSWNRGDPYPELGYLVNAHHLARESGRWPPEELSQIPPDFILKIEGGSLYGRAQYQPIPEDLAAEDWEIFFPPEDWEGSDWQLRELIEPEDLWPEDE